MRSAETGFHWGVQVTVEKFRASDILDAGLVAPSGDEMRACGITPFAIVEAENNVLLNGGITVLLNLLTTTGTPTAYSAANARLGVGDGNGSVPTAAATDTGLAASTNRWYNIVDATYPSVAAQTATFKATVATTNANYAWNEWCIDNGGASSATPGGTALNHKGVSLGTKTSAASWAFTATVTIS